MTHERVVLVEGGDEVCIFPRIMEAKHGNNSRINEEKDLLQRDSAVFTYGDNAIRFSSVEGRSGFANAVSVLLKRMRQNNVDLRSLGLVCDSDDDPAKSLNLLQNALKGAGLPVPKTHAALAGPDPTVGIFVLPDDRSCGSLDTLCRKSVADDRRTRCVDGYLGCLESLGVPVKNRDKSFVFAYSIAMDRRGERAGALAKHGGLNLDHPVFDRLAIFLKELLLC